MNDMLEAHINASIRGAAPESNHVDFTIGGYTFNTYTRCGNGDFAKEYIDICAIDVRPTSATSQADRLTCGHTFDKHPSKSTVDTFIHHLEIWAVTMGRELRFSEFTTKGEIKYLEKRGYKLRPARKAADMEDIWYVEAYKDFSPFEHL